MTAACNVWWKMSFELLWPMTQQDITYFWYCGLLVASDVWLVHRLFHYMVTPCKFIFMDFRKLLEWLVSIWLFKRHLLSAICLHISYFTLSSHDPPHLILLFQISLYLLLTLHLLLWKISSSLLVLHELPKLSGYCKYSTHARMTLQIKVVIRQ